MRRKNIILNIFCLFFLLICSTFFFNTIKIHAKDVSNCSLCHIYKELKIINADGEEKSFYVNKNLFNNMVHKKLTCETCHYTIIQTPHLPEQLKRVSCDTKCHLSDATVDKNFTHELEYSNFRKSAHGDRVENPIGCVCHSTHLITKVREYSPLEINKICSDECHNSKSLMHKYKVSATTVSTYIDSYHGEAIKFNQQKYPGCLTCHSNHNTKIKEEKDSPVNQKNKLEKLCARKDCHKTGLEKNIFIQGTYHQIYKKADIKKKKILTILTDSYQYTLLITSILLFLFYILRFISKIRRKKILMLLLVISIIIFVSSLPFLLNMFIKERGVRFSFNTSPDRYKSICLDCHNLYPHYKNLVMRAFMNLHSSKLACEVCHIRSLPEIKLVEKEDARLELIKRKKELKQKIAEEEEKPLVITKEERGIAYSWYKSNKTPPSVLRKIEGDDGAQIMIFKILDNNKTQILEAKKDTGLDPDFMVSPKAVQCKDCHNKNGLMDFRSLGYSEKMVKEQLEKSRAFEMLQKSEKFLIPKLF